MQEIRMSFRTWTCERPGTKLVSFRGRKREHNIKTNAGKERCYPTDYYDLLNVEPTASAEEIRVQYRRLQKFCHPDVVGESGEPVCVLLNQAYLILSDDRNRWKYDEERRKNIGSAPGFDGCSRSYWNGSENQVEGTFVDETTCIGCRMCNNIAPNTFTIESDYGRARVFCQWGNDRDKIQDAIDSCPVDCIHWVRRQELPILEYVIQEGEASQRLGVAIMNGNSGRRPPDPFDAAYRLSKRMEEEGDQWMGEGSMLDGDKLASEIRSAWLKLSEEVRMKGWSGFFDESS